MTLFLNSEGVINWGSPEAVDGVARATIKAAQNGERDVVLAGIVLPGVLERITEIERTEGTQLEFLELE